MDEHICPYCNGLEEFQMKCPVCGGTMCDCGALQNALGPYAPYEENDSIQQANTCIHQIYCPVCRQKYQMAIPT